MISTRELLHNVWVDNDPIYYMKVHGAEIAKALEDEDDNRKWNKLKNWVADTGIAAENCPTTPLLNAYQVGHNEALEGILWYMNKLEKE